MNTKLRRSVVALATALACLTMMATPASAIIVTFRASLDSGGTTPPGNIRLQNGTSILDIPIGGPPTGGANCGSHIDVSMNIDSSSTTGSVTVTGFESTSRILVGGNHYVAVLTWISSPQAGTITNSSTTTSTTNPSNVASLVVRLRADIYTPTNTSSTATDCNRTTTLVCRFNNINVHFAGVWNNNLHDIQVSHGGFFTSASANLIGLPCSPPFSTYTGGTATVTNMPVHVCEIPAPAPSGSCP